MKSVERGETGEDKTLPEGELAAWRDDIRRHALRQLTRQSPRPPRALQIGALASLLLLSVAWLIHLREAMRPEMVADETMRVSWIDLSQPEPPMPQPPPMPPAPKPHPPSNAVVPRPPATRAPIVQSPPAAEPTLRVYNPDGSLNIPGDLARQVDRAQPTPSFQAATIESSPIMHHQRPLKVRPNHFAQTWYTPSGSPLDDFVASHLTATKEFTTPWGSKIVCQGITVFVAVIGGCAWGFPPPHWEPAQTWKPASALEDE